MEITQYDHGELSVTLGDTSIRYASSAANQLILCARMNGWDKFTNLWSKKTAETDWGTLTKFFEELDSAKQWKVKEAFARLQTIENSEQASLGNPETKPAILKRIELT